MADITITIPDAKVTLVKEALGYQEKIIDEQGEEVDNPQTAKDFVEEQIISNIKTRVKQYERRQAVQNATYSDINIS